MGAGILALLKSMSMTVFREFLDFFEHCREPRPHTLHLAGGRTGSFHVYFIRVRSGIFGSSLGIAYCFFVLE